MKSLRRFAERWMASLISQGKVAVKYYGDDPTSEYSKLRDRLKRALDEYLPGLGGEAGMMPGASVRALVNEITGQHVPNGALLEVMKQLAESVERCNADGSHRISAQQFRERLPQHLHHS